MTPLDIRDLAAAMGAAYDGPSRPIAHICTDTRTLVPGCLFVALTGEKFDGHHYIPKALEQGAAFAVSARPFGDERVLVVEDTRQALLDLAGYYRKKLGLKVVAVTGSVGKTTTKEMAACVLGSAFSTLKTPANLNNEVGLSQTILSLNPSHEIAVLELGVDAPGQMLPLTHCAAPDIGIVTGIGVTHLQQFGTRQAIGAEKLALGDAMADGAPLLLCGDNDLLAEVEIPRLRVLRYGIQNRANEVKAQNLREEQGATHFEILWDGGVYPAQIPTLGRHNVLNALAGFAAGVLLGIAPAQAAEALGSYAPEGMRQKMVSHKGLTVVEDCYNASPDSMEAALHTLKNMPCTGKRIAILSDMLELGSREEEEHRRVGEIAADCADLLLCTGIRSALTVEGARQAGLAQAFHFPDQDSLYQALRQQASGGDVLWFKASRGMHLEHLLQRLYAE
ncbi:MAG: UDP-N-acetylmuramoyl-tripeptide--D-alanyl-D-alanine ligase [Oscillospiraceae bacterium]